MTAVVKIIVLIVAVVVVVIIITIIIFEHFLYNTCIYSFLPHLLLLLLFSFVKTSTTLCRKNEKRFWRGFGELLLRVKTTKKGEGPGGKECMQSLTRQERKKVLFITLRQERRRKKNQKNKQTKNETLSRRRRYSSLCPQ